MLHEIFLALSGFCDSEEPLPADSLVEETASVRESNPTKSKQIFKANENDTGNSSSKNSYSTIQSHVIEDGDENNASQPANRTPEAATDPSFAVFDIIGSSVVLHPSEIEIISEVLQVAVYYRKIKLFFESYGPFRCKEKCKNELPEGYYLTALASSLYEQTRVYQKKVVSLEEQFLENPQIPLSTLLLNIQPFITQFIELCHLIDIVKKCKLHGCKILEAVHKLVVFSVGDCRAVFLRVQHNLDKVLLDQLTHWLLYGNLLDPYNELFLEVIWKDDITKEKSLNSTEKDKKLDTNLDLTLKEKKNKSTTEVFLRLEMLPDFIPLSAAEKILFIGESILFFEREGKKGTETSLISRSGLVLKKKEEEFLEKFQTLSNKGFTFTEFMVVTEAVRECVSEHLYMLVTEAGLSTELNHMKEIFLLGRGELYQAFFTLAMVILNQATPCIANINGLFQRAGRQVLADDSLFDKFTLTHQTPVNSNDENVVDGAWKHLRINYSVEWPLHIIFDSKVQDKYNNILQFLLDIRRAQYRLQQLWVTQKGNKTTKIGRLGLLSWSLRHHMSLLIYNLQYYIQVDVLESQFCRLLEEINEVKDYQRLSMSHLSFLSSVTTQCFLTHSFLFQSIQNILEKIHQFCNLCEIPSSSHSVYSEMESVKEDFDRAASKFFWALSTFGQSRTSQHTAKLVMRIDYNKFYSGKTSSKRFLENFE